jgi:1-deoxy-D-xylulose-5-phosphate reductoisomerase
MKYISIIGSTGSIGTQTLDIVRSNQDLCVTALAAGRNIDLLERQIREFQPAIAAVYDEGKAAELKIRVKDTNTKIVWGMDGLLDVASEPKSSIVVTAIVGMIGIRPTIAAMKAGKDIALANKETLVTAGHIIMPMAKELGVHIYPVDSEHSAIFQCLQGGKKEDLDSLIITASGGPFRKKSTEDLKGVRVEDALKHPNWSMGQKITIDSATLVNKGLEVIEAKWLFDVDFDHIHVVVQPQSVIHSMIQYKDGSVIAQLGTPDMKLPIQYALFYPEHRNLEGQRLDFAALKSISFEEPPISVLKGLPYAYKAGRTGGSMPTVLNAANEKAVALFLNRKIQFLDIYDIIEDAMDAHKLISNPSLEEVLETEAWVYERIESR